MAPPTRPLADHDRVALAALGVGGDRDLVSAPLEAGGEPRPRLDGAAERPQGGEDQRG